ncbi:hypothetical protein [Chloroflexus sp.]|jgi:hypothetical protein|uniref:hypothetical protein n=1 Tax=Chloroflexus sp. TaxID=1904827 RepID=UPI0021DE8106|nr:hypothetical protein [Chloroflexus sp.]GIV93330.1 MAG: hypothetical protein KatS3mg056_2039 [Chloroflexus sp.]
MQQRLWWFTGLIGIVGLLAWLQRPDGNLHVILLPTAGDAILIQSPGGSFTLIDGGRDPVGLAVELGKYLPFWQRRLAAVVLTRIDDQHVPGQLGALRRYQPALALAPADVGGEWSAVLRDLAVPIRRLQPGQQLDLGGARLWVLAVHEGEEGGAVLVIEYRTTRILIHTGGSSGDAALATLAGQPIDLLIYPWQRPIDNPLFAQLRVQAVAFSTGFQAAEPALHTLYERRQLAPQAYHPKLDGAIRLISNGRSIKMTTQLP